MGAVLGGLTAGLLGSLLGDWAMSGLNAGAGGVFNWVMSVIYNVITANWSNLAGATTMNVVNAVNRGLQVIGVSLVTLFTLVNVMKTTTSLVELKRPAVLLRVALRLVVSDVLVVYSYDLFMWLYDVMASMAKMLLTTANYNPAAGFPISDVSGTIPINGIGALLGVFLAFCVFVATIVISFSVLLTVLGRFFKIFIYAMIAPVPLSLLACEETDRMGKRYLASFFCVCLEGLIIAAACALFATYFAAGGGGDSSIGGVTATLASAFGIFGNAASGVAQQVTLLLHISIFAGMVKGSDRVVRELIG